MKLLEPSANKEQSSYPLYPIDQSKSQGHHVHGLKIKFPESPWLRFARRWGGAGPPLSSLPCRWAVSFQQPESKRATGLGAALG